nr:ribonuclease H-like domain-containing protein [Tanacetum cinerariifolium]
MSYGTKSSTSSDSMSVSNDFISCDDSDKSSEVNSNDFASSDSSVKSLEPKPNDSTSCASTYNVSTSEHEPEIESQDCDFYEKQMANKTVGIGVGPVHSRNRVNHPNQFVPQAVLLRTGKENPFPDAEDEGIFDSGCSRSMTGNKERLDDFQVIQGGKVMFGGGKDTKCLVLSKDFKLPDESMVVLRVPRKHNLYTFNLNDLCLRGNLACLVVHASVDQSMKWHRRMGHVNYKNMNRLVKGNLVRGLNSKLFKNDHTCVACCKDTSGDEVDDSLLNFADEIFQKELARLKGLEQKATSDAEALVWVPAGYIPVPDGATMVSTDDVTVHTSSSTDSFFDDEPTTRFPCPSDLGNHDPSPCILSYSSNDDKFGAALNNVVSTVNPTSAVQMRSKALEDPSWVDAMQEEMQLFKFQNVWVLGDLPAGKYTIKTKWILKNKRDARGIVVRNKARLIAQGHRQEEVSD